jgi:hypothetical protein
VLGHVLQTFLTKHFATVGLVERPEELACEGDGLGRFDAIIIDDDCGPQAVRDCVSALSRPHTWAPRIVLLSGGAYGVDHGPSVRQVLLKPVPGSVLVAALDRCLGPGLHRALRARKAAIRHRSG